MHKDLVDAVDQRTRYGEIPIPKGDLALLVLNGEVHDTKLSRGLMAAADYIVAVDGGYDHCLNMGVIPSLLLGDLDSIEAQPEGVPILAFNPAKNATDGEHAISLLAEYDFARIVLLGGLGPGRLDHVSYHFEALLGAVRNGESMAITDGKLWVEALKGPVSRQVHLADYFPEDMVVSLMPRTAIEELVLDGLKWAIDRRDLSVPTSLMVSNQTDPKRDNFKIALQEGELLLYLNTDETL